MYKFKLLLITLLMFAGIGILAPAANALLLGTWTGYSKTGGIPPYQRHVHVNSQPLWQIHWSFDCPGTYRGTMQVHASSGVWGNDYNVYGGNSTATNTASGTVYMHATSTSSYAEWALSAGVTTCTWKVTITDTKILGT